MLGGIQNINEKNVYLFLGFNLVNKMQKISRVKSIGGSLKTKKKTTLYSSICFKEGIGADNH